LLKFEERGLRLAKDLQIKTDVLDELLTGILENQQPLENIPDDDHLDSSDDGSHAPILSI